ncbi:DUF6214 family protein [Streptomyces sp. NPDC058739]|uniref:DUF6214 family protein n=1 Tax=Streptomyces sp. NPDC058739 TaxID=3346618 RepID=UPI00367D620D
MLEASFLNLSDRRFEDGAVSVRPAWEVRESEGATSWFQVRLGFADGARVDALAVVTAGCLSIEDVRAQPALSLADLTVLADWIEGPLSEACGIEPCGMEPGSLEPCGIEPCEESGVRAWTEADTEARLRAGGPFGFGDLGDAPDGPRDPDGFGRTGEPPGQDEYAGRDRFAGPDDFADPEDPAGHPDALALTPVPSRARPAWPRGVEGRWLVAQEYRAAQEDGVDPVLAVMCATGHSRRRSLKLIAQARDIGFLTPRHARR